MKKTKSQNLMFLDTLLVRMLLTTRWMRRAVFTNQLRNIVAQVLYSCKHASYKAQTWQVHYQIEGLQQILACPLSAQLVLYVDSERRDCRNDRSRLQNLLWRNENKSKLKIWDRAKCEAVRRRKSDLGQLRDWNSVRSRVTWFERNCIILYSKRNVKLGWFEMRQQNFVICELMFTIFVAF